MLKALKYLFLTGSLLTSLVLILNFSYTKTTDIPGHVDGQHITVKDLKLRVYQAGTGPDVLFLHGSIGSIEDFETVSPLLKDYRVTLFDRIGHGYSEMPSVQANIASNADYASALIEMLQLKNVIVVGHSYGGSIALKMAINKTPNVKALVLIAPASKVADVRAIEHVFANTYFGKGLLRILSPLIAEDMLRGGLLESLKPNQDLLPEHFIETRLKLWSNPGILYTRTQQTSVVQQEIAEMVPHYSSIKIPTVILVGEKESHEDIYTGSQKLARTTPGAKLRIVKGAGHYLHYKDPVAVSTAISQLNQAQ